MCEFIEIIFLNAQNLFCVFHNYFLVWRLESNEVGADEDLILFNGSESIRASRHVGKTGQKGQPQSQYLLWQ
jgi:hypothetical protein